MTAPTRQSRSVSLVYGGIAGALLMAIAVVAIVVVPPSPPSVAEFAPSAEETIDEAPDDQASRFGAGDGACAEGQTGCEATTTTTSAAATDVGTDTKTVKPTVVKARVRRCVGDPPRQTEDPQSPPCVNYWEGDNGGATWKGVTRDEIRVAFASTVPEARAKALVEYFNRRFEFYGRRLRIVRYSYPTSSRPDQQRASAIVAADAGAFAAVSQGTYSVDRYTTFRTELARLRVLSVFNVDVLSAAELQALHPFAWNYALPFDQLGQNLSEFACRSLVRRVARHAGPELAGRPRSFAILQPADRGTGRGDVRPMVEGLRRCGAEVSVHDYQAAGRGGQSNPDDALLISDLKARNVTTLIGVGTSGAIASLMHHASRSAYQPEWLLVGGGDWSQLSEFDWQAAPVDQLQHLFAMGGFNKALPQSERPATWALREQGHDLTTEDETLSATAMTTEYQMMLVLASGIQAAGPLLTPDTFARGLQGLRFPNPGAGAFPFYQAAVGFSGDHSMVEDEALQWWSSTAPAYGDRASESGGWCYIDQGARWRRGSWPDREHAFFDASKPCR